MNKAPCNSKRFVVHGKPIGAPRMTRRDRWKGRPVVRRYLAWRDLCRLVAGQIPEAPRVLELNWIAYFEPSKSLSKEKRAKLMGTIHRNKPDRDNIDKAILDSLYEEDSAIGSGTITKRWGEPERVEIEIVFEENN